MFIKLTTIKDKDVYFNVNDIHFFYVDPTNPMRTVLDLSYGTEIVKGRPVDIMQIIKENKDEVRHD